jgi:hypothetical protein
MNPRPEAAPSFPLPPGEGGPKGRVRERVSWFADAIISLTPSLSRRERVSWFADAIIYDLIIY